MTACLSDGVPPTAVYLVKPLLIAPIAASLMCCGVSKSVSPAPSPMMSLPSALSFAARAVTARVGEGLMACTRLDSCKMISFGSKKCKRRVSDTLSPSHACGRGRGRGNGDGDSHITCWVKQSPSPSDGSRVLKLTAKSRGLYL